MAGEIDKVHKIKVEFEKKWLGKKGIVAVGIGNIGNKPGIIVSVEKISDAGKLRIPDHVKDVPVKVQIVGGLKAL